MLDFSNQIVLSLSDLYAALKRNFLWIFLGALTFGFILFIYQMKQEITYISKAEYLIKSNKNSNLDLVSSNFERLMGKSSNDTSNGKIALNSFELHTAVVQKLGMQSSLCVMDTHSNFLRIPKNIWKNFLLLKSFKKFGAMPIGHSLLPFSKQDSLTCIETIYTLDSFSTDLTLKFYANDHFSVSSANALIGEGEIGKPFIFENGTFTLVGKPSQTTYTLTLLPIEAAVKIFRNSFKINKVKSEPQLQELSYKHPNAYFARTALNTLLEEQKNLTQKKSQKKMQHQLDYLHQRKHEVYSELESMYAQKKNLFTNAINNGLSFTSSKESLLDTIEQDYYENRTDILDEIQDVYYNTFNQTIPHHRLIQTLEQQELPKNLETLSSKIVLVSIKESQEELISLQLKKIEAQSIIKNLTATTPSIATVIKGKQFIDKDVGCEELFLLQQQLSDHENYSVKDHHDLQKKVELEIASLIPALNDHLSELNSEIEGLSTHISTLNLQALALLLIDYKNHESNLLSVADRLSSFPEQWENEQKQKLAESMQLASYKQLANLVDSKNLSENLDYQDSKPYQLASLPLLPAPPKARLFSLLGAFLGVLLTACFIALQELYYGPTASQINLAASGRKTFGEKSNRSFRLVANQLGTSHSIFMGSKQIVCALELKDILEQRGERVLIIEQPKEHFIASKGFKFDTTYDRVIVTNSGINPLMELLGQKCDQTIYIASDERVTELSMLPNDTFYLFEENRETKQPLLPLKEIQPILRTLFSSSFSGHFSVSNSTANKHDNQSPDPSKT